MRGIQSRSPTAAPGPSSLKSLSRRRNALEFFSALLRNFKTRRTSCSAWSKQAYAVIRETLRSMDKLAIARVVLTNREHVIALEARDKGLMGMLLRYPYEVRAASEYFDDIQDVSSETYR